MIEDNNQPQIRAASCVRTLLYEFDLLSQVELSHFHCLLNQVKAINVSHFHLFLAYFGLATFLNSWLRVAVLLRLTCSLQLLPYKVSDHRGLAYSCLADDLDHSVLDYLLYSLVVSFCNVIRLNQT